MIPLNFTQRDKLDHLVDLMRLAGLLESEKTASDFLNKFTDFDCDHYETCIGSIRDYVLRRIKQKKESNHE